MTVVYSAEAVTSASRYMDDRAGLQAAMDAADALADDPDPPGSVRWGGTEWRRLRAGRYRILYSVEGDLVTIMRIDRITG